MGRQVFYMAGGFFGSIAKGIGSGAKAISKSVKTGSNFGKYVGKTAGGLDSAPRGTYLNDVNAFKIGDMTKSQADQAALLVGDNPKILDDLVAGNLDRIDAERQLSRLFDDAGVRSTSRKNDKLANNIVKHSMDHTNKGKIWRNFTKEQVGGAVGSTIGGGLVLATAGILIYGVASAVSSMFFGAFDKLLDGAAESETGTFIMMGVVIVGSILTINFVRETIS